MIVNGADFLCLLKTLVLDTIHMGDALIKLICKL